MSELGGKGRGRRRNKPAESRFVTCSPIVPQWMSCTSGLVQVAQLRDFDRIGVRSEKRRESESWSESMLDIVWMSPVGCSWKKDINPPTFDQKGGWTIHIGRSPALYLDNRGWDQLGVTNSWIFFELLLWSTCYLETIYIAYKSIQNYDGQGPSDRWYVYVYVYVSVWTKLTINKPPEWC